ncbi:hypothetical protein LJB76_02135 [Clostridia bacterium OttesenSCG-928-O13]|nr:hypothetical protein [Clostridia bacterium OttesenSCG-928-O13]
MNGDDTTGKYQNVASGNFIGGNPYKTIAGALADIPTIMTDSATIHLAPGVYEEDVVAIWGHSTVSNNCYIRIVSREIELAWQSGIPIQSWRPSGGAASSVLVNAIHSYGGVIQIMGLYFTITNKTIIRNDVYGVGPTTIEVRNCVMTSAPPSGIPHKTQSLLGANGAKFLAIDNTVSYREAGVYMFGASIAYANSNKFGNNLPGVQGYGLVAADGGIVSDIYNQATGTMLLKTAFTGGLLA